MRTKFKAWAEPYIKDHPEVGVDLDTLKTLDNFVLEIGSGKGDFLINMAKKYPDLTFVGVEKNVTCSGITAKKLVESKLKNAKLIWSDVINLFEFIKEGSIKTIFLNFSDPWPKKKHFKRRLTSSLFLDGYKKILANDGELIFKTDNKDLFDYSIETLREAGFVIVEYSDDYDGNDPYDTVTEYESFFRNEHTPIHRVKVKYDK